MLRLLLSIILAFHLVPCLGQSDHADELRKLVSELSADITENYILEDEAHAMSDLLQARLANGAYDQLALDDELAARLQADLRSVFNDKHLRIRYGARRPSESIYPPNLPNGIGEVEYEDNIAIIRTSHFPPANRSYRTAIAKAMESLGTVDGVIIDMRNNRGGSPDAVRLMCSYFLEEGILLNSLYFRNRDIKRDFYTIDTPVKYLDIPLVLLTSERTFSAGEEFTYNLKCLERATLIGETTGGGAHPVDSFSLPFGFTAVIPVGMAINPVTHTNWEGTGVHPDIRVGSDIAMTEAMDRVKEMIR